MTTPRMGFSLRIRDQDAAALFVSASIRSTTTFSFRGFD